MIIILSDKRDAHLPFVTQHLEMSAWHLIDPQDLPNKPLHFSYVNAATRITHGNKPLTNVSGVWYRKPQPINPERLPVAPDNRAYSQFALERQFEILLSAFPNARWISNYYAGLKARSKFLQLQIAHNVGFAVADTILSGDQQAVRQFLKLHPESIVKRMANMTPIIDGKPSTFLTTKISGDSPPNLEGLALAPAIFQTAISPKRDIRAIVVDDAVFAAEIKSEHPHKNIRDSRASNYDGSTEILPFELPKDIASKCIAHCKKMDLTFGAIDLVEDTSGMFWFLENNANGQWAYIEKATRAPIGKAIAALLSSEINRA